MNKPFGPLSDNSTTSLVALRNMNGMALNELRQFVYWLFGGGIIRDRDHYRKMIELIDRAETETPAKCPHCGVDLNERPDSAL